MPGKSQTSKKMHFVWAEIPHSQTPPAVGKSSYLDMWRKEGKGEGGNGGKVDQPWILNY